ncbi:MAG TPA: DNA-3-methyladenine glycosylase 2 family protein [Actinomycetota bacterium]|nr:DNA-3-methyladenine glycosylase 2 family protein [Actinomycetota bacterium]
MSGAVFSIVPSGPFSLRALATFGFGQRSEPEYDGIMRMSFCLDGYRHQVGVEVTQDDGAVNVRIAGDADVEAVKRQVARVLSLDHDGDAFLEIGKRDPVIGRLQEIAPGLRPPQFYSPYEAAAWAIISARRPAAQMDKVRRALSERFGKTFELAGRSTPALPTPEQLLGVGEFPGLNPQKIERLHGVARAALDGLLDVGKLTAVDPDAAMKDLQSIPGIGPFYSALIVIRACGPADVLPENEPQALDLTAQLYGLSRAPNQTEFRALAEQWKPFRTWAVVLIRAAGPRLLET